MSHHISKSVYIDHWSMRFSAFMREDVSMIELEVLQADVTELEVDAITNG